MLVGACAAGDQGDGPAGFRFGPRGQIQGEIDIVVALHDRGPGACSHRRDVLVRVNNVIGRNIVPIRDRSYRIGDVTKDRKVNGHFGEARRVHCRVLVPVDACHVRQVKDRALTPRTEQEVGGLRRAVFDLIPNSLHHRSDALRRKDTRGHYVAFAYAEASRRVDSLEQRLLVLSSHRLPEPAKALARLDGPALRYLAADW